MAKALAKNSSGARTTILDAAEELFAQFGFDGVPVRMVSKQADVALSLVTYHFPSKEQLIDAVVTRRSEILNSNRRKHLRKFVLEGSQDLTEFTKTFIDPFLNLIGSGDDGWRNYGEIVAQIVYSTKYSSVLTKHFDETARMFADTLRDMYGQTDSEKSIRAIAFCISVMVGIFASTRRVEAISEGKYDSANLKSSYPFTLKFIAGGIEELMSA